MKDCHPVMGLHGISPGEPLFAGRTAERLKAVNPLIAVENRPSLPVPDHGPVLREERFFVPTLRVQVLRSSSRIPSFSCIVTREKAESIE